MAITDEQVKAFCKAFLEAPEFATFKEKVLGGLEAADAAAWRPIEEYDEKKHGLWVLVLDKYKNVEKAYYTEYSAWLGGRAGWIICDNRSDTDEAESPTHFRPLPEPPK